jgi:hypothetical protein
MPYSIRKIRGQPYYRVFNSETGAVHSKHTTLAKGKAQIRLLDSIEGGSLTGLARDVIIGDVKKYTPQENYKYYSSLIFGRNDFSPKVTKLLDKYGNLPISKIVINRTPVSKILTNTMDWISGGDFYKNLKKTPYDKLFHLRIDITTSKGVMSLEKNEVINADEKPKTVKQAELKQIQSIPNNLTIMGMLEATKKKMGSKFFPYSASSNNCQDFIMAIMKANNIGTKEDFDFVKQNTDVLFKNNPFLKSIADRVTDLGARVNVISQGGSIPSDLNVNMLTNTQIIGENNGIVTETLQPAHIRDLIRIWRIYYDEVSETPTANPNQQVRLNVPNDGSPSFVMLDDLFTLYDNMMMEAEDNMGVVRIRNFPTITEALNYFLELVELGDVGEDHMFERFNPPTNVIEGEGVFSKKKSTHNIKMNGKGSQYMKDKMAKLRAMRGKGMKGCGDRAPSTPPPTIPLTQAQGNSILNAFEGRTPQIRLSALQNAINNIGGGESSVRRRFTTFVSGFNNRQGVERLLRVFDMILQFEYEGATDDESIM